jgi:PAS domain S-box-containing protein
VNRIAPTVLLAGAASLLLAGSWLAQSVLVARQADALAEARASLAGGDQGIGVLRELEALARPQPDAAVARRLIAQVQQDVERQAAISSRLQRAVDGLPPLFPAIASGIAAVAMLAIGFAFVRIVRWSHRARRQSLRAEEALRSLRSLLASAPLAFIAWNRTRGVVLWSDSAERVFGLERARALGSPLPESLQGLRDRVEQSLSQSDTASALPLTLRNERGESIHVSVSASRMVLQEPESPTIAVVVEDVTPHREREARRLDAEREQRDALIREVHHRIKNHLQGVAGLLRQHLAGKPQLQPLLESATAQVLTIAAVHGLQGEFRGSTLDLRGMVSRIAASISGIMRVPIVLDERCAELEGLCVAEEEGVAIAMVLNELLMNSIKHRRAGTADEMIRVCARRGVDEVAIRVTNPGTLPPRFSFALDVQLGTGLGLVRSLLPRHGARLEIEQAGDLVVATLTLEALHLRVADVLAAIDLHALEA